jgi:IS6 family transposase
MIDGKAACPRCGCVAAGKDGRDRRGVQVYRWRDSGRRFTALSAIPVSGYRCPPDVIALAVRWYLRYRLRYADVAELLAERGVAVDPSSVYAWVQECAPLDEAAARSCRRAGGERWSVDETDAKVAGDGVDVYRALDEQGQIVAVDVSAQRATEDAAPFFRRAIAATGVAPAEVTTDGAAAYPPALAAVLPAVLQETGKAPQQRIARVHQHRKGRVRGMRGCSRSRGAAGGAAPGRARHGRCLGGVHRRPADVVGSTNAPALARTTPPTTGLHHGYPGTTQEHPAAPCVAWVVLAGGSPGANRVRIVSVVVTRRSTTSQ